MINVCLVNNATACIEMSSKIAIFVTINRDDWWQRILQSEKNEVRQINTWVVSILRILITSPFIMQSKCIFSTETNKNYIEVLKSILM